MAFAYTVTKRGVVGDEWYAEGTFTSSGLSTGGDINTSLGMVRCIVLQHTGAATVAGAPVINKDFSSGAIAGNAVTIVVTAGTAGIWKAWGTRG